MEFDHINKLSLASAEVQYYGSHRVNRSNVYIYMIYRNIAFNSFSLALEIKTQRSLLLLLLQLPACTLPATGPRSRLTVLVKTDRWNRMLSIWRRRQHWCHYWERAGLENLEACSMATDDLR
jgi:hypothetical protein